MSKKLSPNQKMFNLSVRKLLKQNCQSIDPEGICLYRGPNGTKCAIGHCIPDRLYDQSMEGCGVFDNVENALKNCYPGFNRDFAGDLQEVHDCNFPEFWKTEFRLLASKYQLSLPKELQ